MARNERWAQIRFYSAANDGFETPTGHWQATEQRRIVADKTSYRSMPPMSGTGTDLPVDETCARPAEIR
jgi:hypothetical protein